MLTHRTAGNYKLHATLSGPAASSTAEITFSGEDASVRAILALDTAGFKIIREIGGERTVLKTGTGAPPWRIRILKKGNFYRFWINDATAWVRGPLGEWENIYEPWDNQLSVEVAGGCTVDDCTITTLPWLQDITDPVIETGPAGSHYEEQIIPGAIIEFEERYYMYCMAGMRGEQEGSSRRSIGVAVSDDLETWEMQPAPVLSHVDFPGDNIYPNGAVVTPEGQVAILFCAQQYPEWLGFMLATADDPLGPFTPYDGNPVYKHFTEFAHEFDLVRVDHPDYRYIFFYAGDTPCPTPGLERGDRGYVLYSDDLIHWRENARNPVFDPQTTDDWDAIHVRPRSLNKIGDTWYLWYEGCNVWEPPVKPGSTAATGRPELFGASVWCDTVGLARSPDLEHWEYYPRNPALPALGIGAEQFDNSWTGWPRMVIRGDTGYVFYTGNAQVGLRKIRIDKLINWDGEGGKTIHLA